ncbi:MAG: response regulator transcription factor [Butyrivibrio sp.]|jgi:DNA-binding NarL/FixJ family response regulator|nr:response regulator transcription factor [Butyrivibrio sp.]
MKVVIADDDALVSVSLKTILEAKGEIEVTATGTSAGEAVTLYERYHPDVLLLDIQMGEESGLTAAEQILKKNPQAKILFLTTFSDNEYIIRALNMGAKGYILKQDFEGLVPALFSVYEGQCVFGSGIAGKLPQLLQEQKKFDFAASDISDKEQEIMALVADGLSNKEIADRLFLSEGTVRNYISSILDKLGLRDRTQLAVFYLRKVQQG